MAKLLLTLVLKPAANCALQTRDTHNLAPAISSAITENIGAIVWLGLTLLGVPGAVSLAIIAGLLEVVPNLGPVVATIPAVVVALLQGSTYLPVNNLALALIVVVFSVVVQQLENSLIVPRVLGEAVELPALVVMSGVLVGGSVAGILGALLATPVIATCREVLFYLYRKLLGEEPFDRA